METLGSLGEDAVISLLTKHTPLASSIHTGPGDDCAVIKGQNESSYQLLKTDTIIENVHFLRSAEPQQIGWKAAARVVSDFAAMGGRPEAIVVALAAPKDLEIGYLTELYQGIHRCAKEFAFSVVGGETSSLDTLVLTISGIGTAASPILRSTAQPGDHIYVTGRLGNSLAGSHLTFTPRVQEAAWLVENFSPTSMMDLSDGLAKDLPRLADQSAVGFSIDGNAIPLSENASLEQALADGEDYELLFTSSLPLSEPLKQHWNKKFPKLDLTCIGTITAQERTPLQGGWEHFRSQPQQPNQ